MVGISRRGVVAEGLLLLRSARGRVISRVVVENIRGGLK